ncbi:MAG: CHAT domain-containing protein [Kofleriaceae bacterium]
MSSRETPILVRLDLSDNKSISTPQMSARIPGRPHVAHVVTALECGAPQSDDGTPKSPGEWAACREAMRRLAGEVNRIASKLRDQGESVRLWIGGSAGLPVFFQLGVELSGWSPPVTLLHEDRTGTQYRFALDRKAPEGAYFGEATREVHAAESSELALSIAAVGTITQQQILEYENTSTKGFKEVVRLRSPDKLSEESFAIACRELEQTIATLPSGALTAFLLGPGPLAFAAGYFLNRKRFTTISAPSYQGTSYAPAMVLAAPGPRRQRRRSTVLSVVHFSAGPKSQDRLDLRAEADRIELGLGQSKRLKDLTRVDKTDPDSFIKTLRDKKPSVLHFSGHGGPDGIVFESEDHPHVTISPQQLATALKHHGETVEVVVLNACYSAYLADALLEHVDCVIGMSGKIDDDAALAFATDFYRDLGSKGAYAAYENARNQMAMKRMLDEEIITIKAAPGMEVHEVMP